MFRTQGPQEDCPDDHPFPADRDDDDRAHVPHRERGLYALQHRLGGGVRDEYRFARVESPLQLRVAIEVDDEVTDRRVLVARDQPDLVLVSRKKDRTAVEPKNLAELPGDRLQDVDEVQRRRDFFEDVDDRCELVTLAAELRDFGAELRQLITRRGRGNSLQGALQGALKGAQRAAGWSLAAVRRRPEMLRRDRRVRALHMCS